MRTFTSVALTAPDVTVKIAKGATPVDCALSDSGVAILFFDVPDVNAEPEFRRFIGFPSNQEIPSDWDLDYIGSAAHQRNAYAVHLFERKDKVSEGQLALL